MSRKKYIIAGKKESYVKYCLNQTGIKNNIYENCVYVTSKSDIEFITSDDLIVLLPGWFARKWAGDEILKILVKFPNMSFERLDGVFGKEKMEEIISKNNLKSDRIPDRFDLLDL